MQPRASGVKPGFLPARREKRRADPEPARYEFGIWELGFAWGLKPGMWNFQTGASSQPLKRLVC